MCTLIEKVLKVFSILNKIFLNMDSLMCACINWTFLCVPIKSSALSFLWLKLESPGPYDHCVRSPWKF